MPAHADQLRLLFDGEDIGYVTVEERVVKGFFGRFVPNDAFEKHRALFDEARRWSALNATPPDVAVDYDAWTRWLEVIEKLTACVSIPDVAVAIEEFAIDENLDVEVTFVRQSPVS